MNEARVDDHQVSVCPCCHQTQLVPGPGAYACVRCGTRLDRRASPARRQRAAALAATALVLYLPAILLPVSEIEQFGIRVGASVWEAGISFLGAGEWLVGVVILLCSVVIPLMKMCLILGLSLAAPRVGDRAKATAWHVVEVTGRWGMIDVLLVAILVAWIKLGDLVSFVPGPGLWLFTVMVVSSLLAAASLRPADLWEEPLS